MVASEVIGLGLVLDAPDGVIQANRDVTTPEIGGGF
jgi:hypothetical protein